MKQDLRQRAAKKLLRVTMPDGTVICHKSATMTMIDVLTAIGSENFPRITLESCYLPLLSQEIYPKYEGWMKPICDGWYMNTQGDTDQKYMQLMSIARQLKIDIEVEVGTDFATSDVKMKQKIKRRAQKLLVKFLDGGCIGDSSSVVTFIKTIVKIGIDVITRKGLEYKGRPLITFTKQYNDQIRIDDNRWLTIPPHTRDKYKMLRIIDSVMRSGLEVSMI